MKLYIKEAREKKNISLSELSRRSGVSKSTLFYMELGATDPKLGTLCKIANALDMPAADLFSCDKDMYDTD